uniref:BZIP domain-containing protein n=1 Tax=Kalanchoe fedtschenkoi TaxID=63787 RepID=A0A7N0TW83_KALFE
MANTKGATNLRSLNYTGKHSLLPPKSPLPSIPHAYTDYNPIPVVGPRAIQRPKQGPNLHQRTSSESVALEEQPSWLDELLNEPDTPVRKGGHRRSSSDSFAYLDVADAANREYPVNDHRFNNMPPIPTWASQDLDPLRDSRPFYGDMNSVAKQNNKVWGSSLSPSAQLRDHLVLQNPVIAQDVNLASLTASEKQDGGEYFISEAKLSEKIDHSAKPGASEADTKRAKQQFAQRSRVRKLQYIAELEKNVQALEADGSEVSAELEFLNKQNLILGMENKALKQRLDSLAQEQLIKCLEQEVLEREIGRLRALYQQQQLQPQQQQQTPARHRRSNSRELDSQFANLSLKQKDTNSSKALS